MWWSYLAHGVPGGVGRYMADLPSTYYTHAAEVLRHAAGLPSMASIRRAKKRKIQIAKRRAENEAKAKVWPHRSQTRRRVSCWLTITTRVQADAEAIAAAEAAAARAAAIDRGEAVPEDQPASKPDETPAADGEAGGGDTRAAAQDEPPAAVVSISDDEEEQQRQLMDMFPDPVKRALYACPKWQPCMPPVVSHTVLPPWSYFSAEEKLKREKEEAEERRRQERAAELEAMLERKAYHDAMMQRVQVRC